MASFESLKPQMEAAYFESFSGVSPLLDAQLPNEPDWTEFQPDYSRYALSIGLSIMENNRKMLEQQDLQIPTEYVPQMISEMLRLDEGETLRFLGQNNSTAATGRIPQQTLQERFMVAKFLNDFLKPKLVEGAFETVIRRGAPKHDGRTMIQMVGDGDGVLLIGSTYRSFDWSATA